MKEFKKGDRIEFWNPLYPWVKVGSKGTVLFIRNTVIDYYDNRQYVVVELDDPSCMVNPKKIIGIFSTRIRHIENYSVDLI